MLLFYQIKLMQNYSNQKQFLRFSSFYDVNLQYCYLIRPKSLYPFIIKIFQKYLKLICGCIYQKNTETDLQLLSHSLARQYLNKFYPVCMRINSLFQSQIYFFQKRCHAYNTFHIRLEFNHIYVVSVALYLLHKFVAVIMQHA